MFLLNISVFFISFTGSNAISPGIHSTDSISSVNGKTSQCFKLIFPVPVFRINLPNVLMSICRKQKRRGKLYFLIYFILLILLPCSLSPELGTDYCGSDSYVERFRGFFSLWIIGDIKFSIDECFHFFSYSVAFIPHYNQSVGG